MIDCVLLVVPACLLRTHQRILFFHFAVSHSLDDADELAFVLLCLAQAILEVLYSFGQRVHLSWLLAVRPLLQQLVLNGDGDLLELLVDDDEVLLDPFDKRVEGGTHVLFDLRDDERGLVGEGRDEGSLHHVVCDGDEPLVLQVELVDPPDYMQVPIIIPAQSFITHQLLHRLL